MLNVDAINRERDVILREMQEVNKQTEEVIFDKLHETAYSSDGLGRTILGPVANINALSQADLNAYVSTHYTAPRMVIAGAGAVNHTQLGDLAASCFGQLPTETPADLAHTASFDPAHFVGSDIRIKNDSLPLAHIALAFESFGHTSEHAFR